MALNDVSTSSDTKNAQEWRETEFRSPRFDGLENWPNSEIMQAMLGGQFNAVSAVSAAIPQLDAAVSAAASRLHEGANRAGEPGRLIYVGAGTSGRLGVLDGIELTPTFGWPTARIVYIFAGGEAGLKHAQEGAEDSEEQGRSAILAASVGPNDVILALAASGTTPFTRAAIASAREAGALTISFANNPGAPMLEDAEIGILLRTGPEVLSGSTRLAAGSGQKMALNLFSTALMVRLNKVYRGRMVDMQASNEKLVLRAEAMVCDLTGCTKQEAQAALAQCNYHTKTAILIIDGLSKEQADEALLVAQGDLAVARKQSATGS